jgi:hypothetical protein
VFHAFVWGGALKYDRGLLKVPLLDLQLIMPPEIDRLDVERAGSSLAGWLG